MIERKFIKENLKEFQIKEYITNTLKNVGHSETKLQRTPLGEKIVVSASRPGLVVGRKGENIKKLTNTLKNKFGLENPQIEIEEVGNPNLDAQIIAERIASTIERFGIQKFKGVGHKTLHDVMSAGALGVEIIMSGKIPSQRARSWRFYKGYLKKSGDVSNYVLRAMSSANLKTGAIGIKVSIMHPTLKLPDDVSVKAEEAENIENDLPEKKVEENVEVKEKVKK
ncbi:MAG TPA: 30S ribosomal protein S3 [Candidatus Woesearchaeota archaeon]|nr:MAG: 30S ribosomal protein S3 [Candidatus Woesearchaeota archaeon]HDD70637.1 30S ribosomal protein S3 [Candidatus Woesearchaeota archaeon]